MTTAVNATTPATTSTTSSTNSNGTTGSGDAMNQLSGNFDTFLTLLTTQLKDQDPTSPMDSSTFTQQLVEYSQVEQQIDSNTNLQTLISQGTSASGANATSYLGKTVTVTGGQGALTNGTATWNYSLATTAASTALTVSDSTGKVVYSTAGGTAQGNNSFTWNGEDSNGNQLPDGTYTLAATALDSSGAAIASTVSSAGQVSEINMTGGTPQLVIGSMSVGLSSISNVQN
jgi:flagellar basal-body rod modification protein FlgD